MRSFLLFCVLGWARGRPEATLPYYYQPPVRPSIPTAQVSQSYLPGVQTYNNVIPATSYGTPILRTPILGQSIPSRTYDFSSLKSQSEPLVSVQKHIYVHVPPPDPEELPQKLRQPLVTTRKHYKIIFVKVPSYPTAQYVAQPQQELHQEKTLVYVLVKRPDEPSEVKASQVAPAPLDRPEVYFIKYRGKQQRQEIALGPQHEDGNSDSMVVDSSVKSLNQGYRYDRPAAGVLK
ncbi:uncharacterized protein [Euwallacea fornicatus]|uniref:uncharacterized protein n=1 Tax=Euwallacea fornicatus TaxID=995702 RepID=UPI00338D6B65